MIQSYIRIIYKLLISLSRSRLRELYLYFFIIRWLTKRLAIWTYDTHKSWKLSETWSWLWRIASHGSAAPFDAFSSRSPSSHLFTMRRGGTERERESIEWSSSSRVPRELWKGSRRACPVPACQLRNRDLTVVTCSVSTIVCRTERGIQSGRDDGLHDGRTGGQHDAPAARWSCLPQSVPLPGVLWTSHIKVRTDTANLIATSIGLALEYSIYSF